MDVCSQLRGRGVGDSWANGNPQEFGEPGDDGKGLRAFRVGEVVRGLQGRQDQSVLQTKVWVVRARSRWRVLRLPGLRWTRRRSARRRHNRGPWVSWRPGLVTGPKVGTRRWRSHLRSWPGGSSGGARSPCRTARSPTRLRRAAVRRPLSLAARRGVGRSVGLRSHLVMRSGRSVGRPVPDGPRTFFPTSGRRVARSPEAFVTTVQRLESPLRSRCCPSGGIHQRWRVVGVAGSSSSTPPLDQSPFTVGLKVFRMHVSFKKKLSEFRNTGKVPMLRL